MTAERVDPAALLIAVLAVGIGPLTEDGLWDVINTVIAVAALLIILPYIFAPQSRKHLIESGPRLPVAVAVAFIVGIASAWPIQNLVAGHGPLSTSTTGVSESQADQASRWVLVVAAVVALALWTLLSHWVRLNRIVAQVRRSPRPHRTPPATEDHRSAR